MPVSHSKLLLCVLPNLYTGIYTCVYKFFHVYVRVYHIRIYTSVSVSSHV
jgi:hypothetical protein